MGHDGTGECRGTSGAYRGDGVGHALVTCPSHRAIQHPCLPSCTPGVRAPGVPSCSYRGILRIRQHPPQGPCSTVGLCVGTYGGPRRPCLRVAHGARTQRAHQTQLQGAHRRAPVAANRWNGIVHQQGPFMNQRASSRPRTEARGRAHVSGRGGVCFRTRAPGLDGRVHVRHAEGRHAREERLGRDDRKEHLWFRKDTSNTR